MNNGQKVNYNLEMEKTIETFDEQKPSLFLHACCAPCSSSCLERIAKFFEITVYFYNPNIHPEQEYYRRRDEILGFVKEFNLRNNQQIKIIEDNYDKKDYDAAVRIDLNPELAREREKGERCRRCYEFRMKKAFALAEEKGFDYFATTLTLSPLKDSEKINEIGRQLNCCALEKGWHIQYLFTDFKKKNGYLRSLELSKEYDLYRQTYCGCIYSLINSTAEKAAKAEKTAGN